MENPPRFDGPPAQLAQAGGPTHPQWVIDQLGGSPYCTSEEGLRNFHYPSIQSIETKWICKNSEQLYGVW